MSVLHDAKRGNDYSNHRIVEWKKNAINGQIVAGENGEGNRTDQLNTPTNIFIDEDHSVYVSDMNNHRVMKYAKRRNCCWWKWNRTTIQSVQLSRRFII